MRVPIVIVAALVFLAGESSRAGGPVEIELEAGPVWQGKNDLRIPNDATATRFSLVDVVGTGPFGAGRATVLVGIGDRHQLRGLAAPLDISASGASDAPIDFAGAHFDAGREIDALYRFNSWRLTYRYRVGRGAASAWWIGFTAKVRDAKVELRQGPVRGTDTDIGFVPLLHLRGDVRIAPRWLLEVEADALGGGPGRAVDASLGVSREFASGLRAGLRYRTLEGGADVDSVYSFAWLHYALVSVTWRVSG